MPFDKSIFKFIFPLLFSEFKSTSPKPEIIFTANSSELLDSTDNEFIAGFGKYLNFQLLFNKLIST